MNSASNATSDPAESGLGDFHSTLLMFWYHAVAFSGSET
jgi:hypothetical protein